MSDKYWYEEGMCNALGYKGQYPVIYRSEDGDFYIRVCMACDAISKGICRGEKCEVFEVSPAEMTDNWELRDKKMR